MRRFGVGQGLPRVEDERLLTGRGRYSDDVTVPGEAVAVVVRSPFAHAELSAVDVAAARAAPGVLAVYTGADLAAEGIGDLPCKSAGVGTDGRRVAVPPRPALAKGRVRHVGEPVAVVVAETAAQARDAAELVDADYAALPAVVDLAEAVSAKAPQIWEHAPSNVALDWETGDAAATEAAFAEAAHVTRLELVNNRVVVNPMEPRAALGEYDARDGRFTLTTSTQGVHGLRDTLSKIIFHVPKERVRVVSGDVGGGFGCRAFLYPEHVLVLYAARHLGRAVKWTGERGDIFVSDTHGRDHLTTAELAIDGEGRFLAVRARTLANMGAYLSEFAQLIPTMVYARMLPGCYRVKAFHAAVTCVYTNTVPVDAYRGAGRPEALYVIERLVDAAAGELGLARDEIRRRNFIPPQAMPYRTPSGMAYDSGNFERLMDIALARADWAGFAARREESAGRGRLRGIAMATYVESCGGVGEEAARVRLDPDGGATLFIGTQDNGQGHATAYAQLLHEALGLAPEQVRVRQGDSGELDFGGGTGGSRSLLMGGLALRGAVDRALARARRVASHLLEVGEDDVAFTDGVFSAQGTNRSVTLGEVAGAAAGLAESPTGRSLPAALGGAIDEQARATAPGLTFPNGCHVCELEVDPETGAVEILRYLVVDDFGTVVNPLLCRGQIHGGVAQGIGQALREHTVHDPESGQLLSGTFMDYAMPRADDLPDLEVEFVEDMPCTTNPLGVKGSGEAGAIAAPPAFVNALIDALGPLGVSRFDMPATPERVWRAIAEARAAEPGRAA